MYFQMSYREVLLLVLLSQLVLVYTMTVVKRSPGRIDGLYAFRGKYFIKVRSPRRFDELDALRCKYFIKVRSHGRFDELDACIGKYFIKMRSHGRFMSWTH